MLTISILKEFVFYGSFPHQSLEDRRFCSSTRDPIAPLLERTLKKLILGPSQRPMKKKVQSALPHPTPPTTHPQRCSQTVIIVFIFVHILALAVKCMTIHVKHMCLYKYIYLPCTCTCTTLRWHLCLYLAFYNFVVCEVLPSICTCTG